MKINIDNYKNIDSLALEIEDNKVNHIFGISGSGKSSIAKALSSKVSDVDIRVGKKNEDCIIKVDNKEVNNSNFSIFDLESSNNLIFNDEQNENIYEILFSDNKDMLETIEECNSLLSKFEDFKNVLLDYKNKIELVIKHFDVKLKSNNTAFSGTSKLVKLTNELSTIKSSKFITTINKKGPDFITWLKSGKSYEVDNICPYCEKKISDRRDKFITEIIKLTPKNFEIITKDNHFLEDVGIKTPNYRYSREVERAKKEIIDLYSFEDYINSIIELFEDYKTSKLDMNKIQQIKISKKFEKIFPDQIEIINEINSSLKQIKIKLGKIKTQSNKIIRNNKNKINKYLSLMGIPYEFCESSFDIDKQTASFYLFLKEDEEKADRRNGLSYGEKNIISLIFFLLGNKNKTLLIDDPASSYDEYRRSIMFKMLYEFKNNRTIILFSHDQVFVKFATLYKKLNKKKETKINKFIKENTGCILQYSNYQHKSLLKEINLNDFNPLCDQVEDFIKNKNLSYYRKIINIRVLSEMDKNKSSKYKNIYNYCSAILHNVKRDDIYSELEELNISEQEIIDSISDNYHINIEQIPNDYFKDFNIGELSNFEKVYYYREMIGRYSFVYAKKLDIKDFKKEDIDLLKTEFDNIVHLNDRLFVSLNPYKFDYFSPIIYEIITNSSTD